MARNGHRFYRELDQKVKLFSRLLLKCEAKVTDVTRKIRSQR